MSHPLKKLDVVRHKRTGVTGVIRKIFRENEEFDSDSSDDSDYDDYDDELENGKFLIEWVTNGEFHGEELESLEFIDRPFYLGDVVKLKSKPQFQSGYIESISIRVDIKV